MTDEELEERIHALVGAIAAASPPPPGLPANTFKAHGVAVEGEAVRNDGDRHGRRGLLVAGVCVAVLVVAAASVWRSRPAGDPVVTGPATEPDSSLAPPISTKPAPSSPLAHEVVEYHQDLAHFDCGTLADKSTGTFEDMTFETWADPTEQQYAQTVRYPDGRTRHVILVGPNQWYPTAVATRGALLGRVPSCDGVGILLAEPGQASIFTLNPFTAVPQLPGVGPAHQGYRELGSHVDGTFSDSKGRVTELWRQTITGYRGEDGTQPLTQTHEWYVDPSTGLVQEETFSDTSPAYGIAMWRATLIAHDDAVPPAELFDTTGFTALPVAATGQRSSTTIGAEPANATTTVKGPPPTGATSTEANATAAVACAPDNLAMQVTPGPYRGTGRTSLEVVLDNTGPTCSIAWPPTITVEDSSNDPVPFVVRATSVAEPRTLAAGGKLALAMTKYRCDTGDVSRATKIVIQLNGQSVSSVLPDQPDLSYCGPNDPGSTIETSSEDP